MNQHDVSVTFFVVNYCLEALVERCKLL